MNFIILTDIFPFSVKDYRRIIDPALGGSENRTNGIAVILFRKVGKLLQYFFRSNNPFRKSKFLFYVFKWKYLRKANKIRLKNLYLLKDLQNLIHHQFRCFCP